MPTSPEEWHIHWQKQDQPWRTEPEISLERQQELARCRAIVPDIEKGIYPLGGMRLSRADIEWLLTTHENGRGPVDWSDESQREREGLDLRGADLSRSVLSGLPLACMRGGLDWKEWDELPAVEADLAGVHLENAILSDAHLEGSILRSAHLEEALLDFANLEGAYLIDVHLEGTYLAQTILGEKLQLLFAHLEGAELRFVSFKGIDLRSAHLEGASLHSADLEGALLKVARLEGADLSNANLKRSDLSEAHLEGANLQGTYLEEANLGNAYLQGKCLSPDDFDRIRRWSKDFPEILLAADLRRAFFSSATVLDNIVLGSKKYGTVFLVDVRWSEANLSVIDWASVEVLGDELRASQEMTKGEGKEGRKKKLSEIAAAVRANRQLAIALESQGLNEDSARFAYRAQILQRKVLWKQRKFWKWLGSMLLALLAGYGYRMWRILVAYLLIVLLCAGAYFVLGMFYEPHLSFLDAVLTSITAFHGRVFSEPFLHPGDPQLWVTAFEAVAGLVIEGVFIAMLTQRFFGK